MRYCGYLFDLDGTLYRGNDLIPGARPAVEELRRRGCRVVFLSNKPLDRREAYADKLTQLGLPTDPGDVINSSLALARFLSQEMPGATVFPIGEPPLMEELAAAGLGYSETPQQIEAVIASFDRTFDYRKLNIAFQALRRGARLFATNADRTCPVSGGEIPDAAAVIGALEACTGREVELVAGKPNPLILEMALQRLELPADACLMTGDRLETDILMGQRAGMATALVLTGVTRQEDLATAAVRPDFVLDSVAQLLSLVGP